MLKTFICFHLHDDFIEEREVESRDIPITDIPKTAYAYQFYDKNVVKAKDGELCYGAARDESPLVYIDCVMLTIDDLNKLITDMEENCVSTVIVTPWGEIRDCDEEAELTSRYELEEKL